MEPRIVLSANVATEFLYVADTASDTVQRFDGTSGTGAGTFVKGNKSLEGPRGVVFDGVGYLLLANQNEGRGKRGEILRYDAGTGAFVDRLVPFQSSDAPLAPRGIVVQDNVLYVASLQEADTTKAGIAPDGRVATYNASTGKFLGNLEPPADLPGQYNPRGIVFGPDGDLYVSVFDSSNPLAGHVLRFDLDTGQSFVFAANDGDGVNEAGEVADLHRPEGLTFGPDGNLYVTSFRADANDTDKILILDGATGAALDAIQLDAVGQPRAFAQAIVFGPAGDLFVPISGNGPDTGAVRRYDVAGKTFSNFVPPGTLGAPWYATFTSTDPATLAYAPAPTLQALAHVAEAQGANRDGRTEPVAVPEVAVQPKPSPVKQPDHAKVAARPLSRARAIDQALTSLSIEMSLKVR